MPSLIGRCGGGGGLTVQSEWVDGSVVVTAVNALPIPLAHVSGDALLDFTDPRNPVPMVSGLYAFTGAVTTENNFAGTKVVSLLVTYTTAPTTTLWIQQATGYAGLTQAAIAWCGTVQLAQTTGKFQAVATNLDSVTHTFDAEFVVVKIG